MSNEICEDCGQLYNSELFDSCQSCGEGSEASKGETMTDEETPVVPSDSDDEEEEKDKDSEEEKSSEE